MQTISPAFRWTYAILLAIVLSWPGMSAPIAKADSQVFNPAVLVKEINTATRSTEFQYSSPLGNRLLFAADNGVGGKQLWVNEGTATGIFRLKAVEPTTAVVMSGGVGYFAARDAEHGVELWRTDGTVAGTQLVKDIFPGTEASYPHELVDLKGTLFFVAHHTLDVNGYSAISLWKSDGTSAGTVPVVDPLTQPLGDPRALTPVNHKLFFIVDGTDVVNLWVSDGTAAGTRIVKSFVPVPLTAKTAEVRLADSPRIPIDPPYDHLLTAVGDTLFLRATDGVHGVELWRSDGTTVGTTLVKDIAPESASAAPATLTNVQGTLFFTAVGAFWKSDGSTAGTVVIRSGLAATEISSVGNRLLIAGIDAEHGRELWQSDGTTAGTVLLKDIKPGTASAEVNKLTPLHTKVFFVANAGLQGWELWQSDGTAAGTTLVKSMQVGVNASPTFLAATNGRLFFDAYDEQHGWELWSSEGTAAGTALVADLNQQPADSRPGPLIAVGSHIFFLAEANHAPFQQLWRSDSTTDGTQPIEQIGQVSNGGSLVAQAVNSDLYVSVEGEKLWRIDSVTGAASLLKMIAEGQISAMATINNQLFFLLFSLDAQQSGLWHSDGTAEGTQLVKPLQAGSELLAINNTLYFPVYTTELATEVWKSDGSAAGTTLLKDINPGAGDARPMLFTNVNGTLFFRAGDGLHGEELWKSDGTTTGTVLVKDIFPGPDGSVIDWPTVVNNRLFFVSNDRATVNYEVWVSDGTAAGTFMLKDIQPDAHIPTLQPGWLTAMGNNLLFVANDVTTNGEELWISDGTTNGTTLLKDINPGVASSVPSYLTNVNGIGLFAATDGSGQRMLWRTDGTAAGTQQLQKLTPQANLYNLQQPAFVAAGDHIFFSADNGATGQELWQIPLSTTAPTLKAPVLVSAPTSGIGRIHLDYGNQSTTPQQGVTLTANLAEGLTYLDSTSPVTPTITGNTLVWQLPDLGVLAGGEVDLRVQMPAAPLGTRYPVTLTLSMVTGTAAPNQTTTTTVEVMVADQIYLPFVQK